MRKKSTLIVVLTSISIILAILLSIAVTYRIAVEPMQNQIATLQKTVETIRIQTEVKETKEIITQNNYVPKDGKDGLTPPCYYEPTQCRGKDGSNSVATNTETKTIETIIKEQQTAQPYKDVKFNPVSCAIETKMSTDRYWEIMVQLNPSVVQCVISVQSPLRPNTGLVEL